MSTPNDVPSLCQCGRDKRIHCPYSDCGSRTKYCLSTQKYAVAGVSIMVYRCRTCGREYDDLDRQDCKAPPLKGQYKNELERSGTPPTPFSQELEGLTMEEKMRRVAEKIRSLNKR